MTGLTGLAQYVPAACACGRYRECCGHTLPYVGNTEDDF